MIVVVVAAILLDIFAQRAPKPAVPQEAVIEQQAESPSLEAPPQLAIIKTITVQKVSHRQQELSSVVSEQAAQRDMAGSRASRQLVGSDSGNDTTKKPDNTPDASIGPSKQEIKAMVQQGIVLF